MLCTEQDVSTEPSPHMAGQGHARTDVTIHLLAVQQITHYWLLPAGFQGRCCSTAPEEKRARRQ